MLRFGEAKIAKEKFYAAKQPIKVSVVNVGNIVISKLIKIKTNSKYLIGCLAKAIRPLVLIMPKISIYIKTFTIKDRDQYESNKFMTFHIEDEKLVGKYKIIWTKI